MLVKRPAGSSLSVAMNISSLRRRDVHGVTMAKPKCYDYVIDRNKGVIFCVVSTFGGCTANTTLWSSARSNFHDAELQRATEEINKILDGVQSRNTESSRHLSFVNVHGRLMLVWTHRGVVGSADTDDKIATALDVLGLRRRQQTL
jgi:hypothetical protein